MVPVHTIDLVAILKVEKWIVVDVTMEVNSRSGPKVKKGFELGSYSDLLHPPVPPILLHQLVSEEELVEHQASTYTLCS